MIQHVYADLKDSAQALFPSGKSLANAAWLVLTVIALNPTRAAATIVGAGLDKATAGTVSRKLISMAAKTATSARHPTLHLPEQWAWEATGTNLFTSTNAPPQAAAA